jgi:hypothetical protein
MERESLVLAVWGHCDLHCSATAWPGFEAVDNI